MTVVGRSPRSARYRSANAATVFVAAAAEEFGGVGAVAAQDAVHVGGEAVAGLAGVHHEDAATGAAEH